MHTNSTKTVGISRVKVPEIVLRNVDCSTQQYESLLKSIKHYGVLMPILVARTATEGEYDLIKGFQRLTAAKEAGYARIPATVIVADEEERLELRLGLALTQAPAKPSHISHYMKQMISLEPAMQMSEMVIRLNVSADLVSQHLQLGALEPTLRDMVNRGEMSLAVGCILTRLTHVDQLAIYRSSRGKGFAEVWPHVEARIRQLHEVRHAKAVKVAKKASDL